MSLILNGKHQAFRRHHVSCQGSSPTLIRAKRNGLVNPTLSQAHGRLRQRRSLTHFGALFFAAESLILASGSSSKDQQVITQHDEVNGSAHNQPNPSVSGSSVNAGETCKTQRKDDQTEGDRPSIQNKARVDHRAQGNTRKKIHDGSDATDHTNCKLVLAPTRVRSKERCKSNIAYTMDTSKCVGPHPFGLPSRAREATDQWLRVHSAANNLEKGLVIRRSRISSHAWRHPLHPSSWPPVFALPPGLFIHICRSLHCRSFNLLKTLFSTLRLNSSNSALLLCLELGCLRVLFWRVPTLPPCLRVLFAAITRTSHSRTALDVRACATDLRVQRSPPVGAKSLFPRDTAVPLLSWSGPGSHLRRDACSPLVHHLCAGGASHLPTWNVPRCTQQTHHEAAVVGRTPPRRSSHTEMAALLSMPLLASLAGLPCSLSPRPSPPSTRPVTRPCKSIPSWA